MCHFSELIKRHHDVQNDVKFLAWANFFLAMWELRDQNSSFKIIADRINTLWGQGPASLERVYSAFNLTTLQYAHEEEVNS